PVVSDHHSGDHCGSSGDGGAAQHAPRRSVGDDVDRDPGVVRRGVRHHGALDLRANHDGVAIVRKTFLPLAAVVGLMFVAAPFLIARAPFESTMGLIQKIFYFHVPSWIAMYSAIAVCG